MMELLTQDTNIWVAISFIVFCLIAFKLGRKSVVNGLDSRIEDVRSEIENAERLRVEAQELLAQYQRKQRDAEKESKEMISKAKDQAKQLRQKRVRMAQVSNSMNDVPNEALEIVQDLGRGAKAASAIIAQTPTDKINQVLKDISAGLEENAVIILEANAKDVLAAKEKELTPALIDRLTLNEDRLKGVAQSVLAIAELDDPVGDILETATRPNGLIIDKVSVPIGVLGMIYESRPNVTIDAAALCLKSHNAVILRGGSESFNSSRALHAIVQGALQKNELPIDAVSMVPNTDRVLVGAMLQASEYIDVMIPRGGKGLTGLVMEQAKMPVFAHLDGNCHIYVHASAQAELALNVIENAKLRRTGICGAAESLLFDDGLNTNLAKNIVTKLLDQDCIIDMDHIIQTPYWPKIKALCRNFKAALIAPLSFIMLRRSLQMVVNLVWVQK